MREDEMREQLEKLEAWMMTLVWWKAAIYSFVLVCVLLSIGWLIGIWLTGG